MNTSFTDPVVVYGMLQADGTLRLDNPPGVPPGRMEVTLRPVSPQRARLPQPPIEDMCVAPPFELPRSSNSKHVDSAPIFERLPDPIFIDIDGRN